MAGAADQLSGRKDTVAGKPVCAGGADMEIPHRWVRETWDQRIRRATDLAQCHDDTRSLLMFYADILALQKQLYDYFRARLHSVPTGALDGDGVVLREASRTLLSAIANRHPHSLVPERLVDDAR